MLESNIIAVSPAAFSHIANQAGPALIETTLQASPSLLARAAGKAGAALKATPDALAKIGREAPAVFVGVAVVAVTAKLAYDVSRWTAPRIGRAARSAYGWARSKDTAPENE